MGFAQGCIAAALLVLLTACVNQEVMVQKQNELESRMESLTKGYGSTTVQLQELHLQILQLQEQAKSFELRMAALQESIAKLASQPPPPVHEQQSALPDTAKQKIELVNDEGPSSSPPQGAELAEAYMKAFGLYSANRYEEAIQAFNQYLKQYPRSEFSANAQYWTGECYYSIGDYQNALSAFKKVSDNYPNDKKAPDALLKAGYTLFSLQRPKNATTALQTLLTKYPNSPAATKARERLEHHQ